MVDFDYYRPVPDNNGRNFDRYHSIQTRIRRYGIRTTISPSSKQFEYRSASGPCLLTMSNSRDVGQEATAADITEILSLTAVKQENLVDAVQAVLGDNALMEKAWQDTGMLAEAVLHAHAHGRPTLKSLVQMWNKMLQKELEHTPSVKTDAAAAFLASLEDPKFTSLAEAGKKPPIEILPPGMASLSAPPITINKKPLALAATSQGPSTAHQSPEPTPIQKDSATSQNTLNSQTDKPLMLEAPPAADQANGTLPAGEPVSSTNASREVTESPPPLVEAAS
ncbi:hypothetical protein BHE74_00041215 [Ensete ventricosum]|nr:hypothetical protein BHE74_00041215 [Ensete ventricosum]